MANLPPKSPESNIARAGELIAQALALLLAPPTAAEAPAFYDQGDNPLRSSRRFREAVSRAGIEHIRDGKRVLVRREVFDAWLATQTRRGPVRAANDAADDPDEQLFAARGLVPARRAGGAR